MCFRRFGNIVSGDKESLDLKGILRRSLVRKQDVIWLGHSPQASLRQTSRAEIAALTLGPDCERGCCGEHLLQHHMCIGCSITLEEDEVPYRFFSHIQTPR